MKIRLEVGNRGVVFVSTLTAEGKALRREQLGAKPTGTTVRRCAAHLTVPEGALWLALSQLPADMTSGTHQDFDAAQLMGREPTVYRLRGIDRKQHSTHASFDEALTAPCDAHDPVIEWEGLHDCACVDLDFHHGGGPTREELERSALCAQPVPAWWWITSSGCGLRLVYLGGDGLVAEDLAACAGARLCVEYPKAKVEIIHRTRRPPGEPHRCQQTTDMSHLHGYFGGWTADQATIDAWMEERGFVPGQRYEHTLCPVNPYPAALNNEPPVLVGDRWIKCYICHRDGTTHGSKDPGFFPGSSFVGERVASRLKWCVHGFAHWGHARYVVEQEMSALPEDLARSAYKAMLRLHHGDDPRVETAVTVGEPNGIVRMQGYWSDRHGHPYRVAEDSALLAQLPAAQTRDMLVDRAKLDLLRQNIDLAENGFPALQTIWGLRLTRRQVLPPNRIYTVLQTADLRHPESAWRRPRYAKPKERISDPWRVVERAFPGVNRAAVRLMIAAKGCSEFRAGLPPMMFFSGPTGAGKTASAQIAAGMCGDHVYRVAYTPSSDRLFAAVRLARERGSFAAFDEFIKGAKRSDKDAESAMEIVLDLDENSLTHMMYVGPVPLGDLPVFAWTDTAVPHEVMQHKQIGRRMHHVYLPETVSWEGPMAACGIRDPGSIRSSGDRDTVAACDAIVSEVIDEFFPPGATDFARVAKDLGFPLLRDTDVAREKVDLIRRLYALVCSGAIPKVRDQDRTRWPDPTWLYVDLDCESEAATVWEAISERRDPVTSRALDELDLKAALGLKTAARVERRCHGRKLVLRFRSLDGSLCNVELAADAPHHDGPGDSVPSVPEEGGSQGLPPSLGDSSAVGELLGGGHDPRVGPERKGASGAHRRGPGRRSV